MSLGKETNQMQAQSNKWKVIRVALPVVLLLAICTAATAYFPKGTKAAKSTASPSLRANSSLPPTVTATDPGPRPLPPNAGGFLSSLSSNEKQIEPSLTTEFNRTHDVIVTSPTDGGLGPRFNENSCASCHAYPAVGGSSPPANPLFSIYNYNGATNTMPSFITSTGPILEARFINQPGTTIPDGTVHQLFTIKGSSDAAGCGISQPDFVTAAAQNNLALRQVSPTYGDGLIEVIRNIDITNNMNANLTQKASLGITGHPNYSGNDGSIQRFGWKAQVRSTFLMAANQMNVEMGVTNETFPNEIDQTPGCVLNPVPETVIELHSDDFDGNVPRRCGASRILYSMDGAAKSRTDENSTKNGKTQFTNAGCVYCHTTSFTTPATSRPGLGNITINLYSDLLVHHMGPGLADGLPQGTGGSG